MNEYLWKNFDCSHCGENQTVYFIEPGRTYPSCEFCGENLIKKRKKDPDWKEKSRKTKIFHDKVMKVYKKENIPFEEARKRLLKQAQKPLGIKKLKAFGEEKTLSEWIEDERCPYSGPGTLYSRVTRYNWDPEKAITTPPMTKTRRPGL